MAATALDPGVDAAGAPGGATDSKGKPLRTWQFSKTQMCKFAMLGICAKGEQCPFAHSKDELRPLPDLTCTKLCKKLIQTGMCDSATCTYAHSKEELRTTSTFHKTKLCRFSQTGHCALGTKCNFAHSQQEIRPLDAWEGAAFLDQPYGGMQHPGYPPQLPSPAPLPSMAAPAGGKLPRRQNGRRAKERGPGDAGSNLPAGRRGHAEMPDVGSESIGYGFDGATITDDMGGFAGGFAGAGCGAARSGGQRPNMAGMPGLDWMAGMGPSRQHMPMAQLPASGSALPVAESYGGHHGGGVPPMQIANNGADGFRDGPAYVTQMASAQRPMQPQIHGMAPRYFDGADAGGVGNSILAGEYEYGMGPGDQGGTTTAHPPLCLPQGGFAPDAGGGGAMAGGLDGNGVAHGWGPSSFDGLQDGNFTTVDQKDDVWQIKNTFLTISPQMKPIRSVRTAEGALCTLGASGVEMD